MSHVLMQLLSIQGSIQIAQNSVQFLENKLDGMVKGRNDEELKSNSEFLDHVKLLVCGYNNLITSL